MVKYIYIDGVNGDDNNSGTSSSPLKTFDKALSKAKYGVKTAFRFKENQTFTMSININVGGMYLDFATWGSGRAVLKNDYEKGFYATTVGYITASNINFETPTVDSPSIWTGFISKRSDSNGTVYFNSVNIKVTLGNTPFYRNSSGPQNCYFSSWVIDIEILDTDKIGRLILSEHDSLSMVSLTGVTIDNDKTLEDVTYFGTASSTLKNW